MSKKIKKRGQSFIEFCMCVPILLMMVLGLYDICVMNAMRIELQGFTQRAVNSYVVNSGWSAQGIVAEAERVATSQTVFCLTSSHGTTKNCNNPRKVYFELGIPKNNNRKWAAGNIACIRGTIEYKNPLYKALLSKGAVDITATSCSSVEYSGAIKGNPNYTF